MIEIRKKDRYAFNCATQRERNAFHAENPVFPDTRRARTKRQRNLTREEIPISTHATKSPYNNTEGIFPLLFPCYSSRQRNDTEDFFSRAVLARRIKEIVPPTFKKIIIVIKLFRTLRERREREEIKYRKGEERGIPFWMDHSFLCPLGVYSVDGVLVMAVDARVLMDMPDADEKKMWLL